MSDNILKNVRILSEGEIPTKAKFVGTRKLGTIKQTSKAPEYRILNYNEIPEMAYYQGGQELTFSALEYLKIIKNIIVSKVKNASTKVLEKLRSK